MASVDRGYSGDRPAEDAAERGIGLEVVRVPGAKRGFVLPPSR